MRLINWQISVAAALMVFASFFGSWAKPTVLMAQSAHRSSLASAIPAAFNEWKEDDQSMTVEPAPDVMAQINALYSELLNRTYVDKAGNRVMVTIAYGRDQSDGFKVHRPEVCYASQGFEVSDVSDAAIPLGDAVLPVKHVMTRLKTRSEPVTYWMVIGDKAVNSAAEHKIEQIKYAFRGIIADGLLFRVSTISADPADAYRVQADFIREIMTNMPKEQRARFFGQIQEKS
jgi:EpsI family protein